MFHLMGRYLRQYKTHAILSPILMILEVVADILAPFLMAEIIDRGIPSGDNAYITRIGITMILVALWGLLCGSASAFFGAKAGFGYGSNVRDALYKKIQTFSFSQLDLFSVPSLITRLTNDVTIISQVGMMTLRMAIRAPVMMILAIIMAFRINKDLAFIFAIGLPILGVSVAIILFLARKRFRKMQRKIDGLNGVVQEDLTSIRVIKSFVREDYERQRFGRANDALKKYSVHAFTLVILFIPIMNFIVYGSILAVLWFGGQRVIAGSMGSGQLMSFVTYCTQILMSLMMLSMYFFQLTRANTSAERIREVLNTEADLKSPEDGGLMTVPDGSVDFIDVDFRYAGNNGNSLQDIDLHVDPGETVGIIGSTGSAKTTLVQMIPRLYDSTRGEVKVGGHDVREYNLTALRDAVSFVLQKNTLFSGTLRENMQWGNADATDEEIILALKQAQAWEFVKKSDGVLDSWVEQGGLNFSGGQRQRLCIARALLKDPLILILDDSTSAVDMTTDAKIRQALSEYKSDVTTFIIAQRIASIQDADKILVMADGGIQAMGSHEELLADNQIYQDLYETQVKGAIAE